MEPLVLSTSFASPKSPSLERTVAVAPLSLGQEAFGSVVDSGHPVLGLTLLSHCLSTYVVPSAPSGTTRSIGMFAHASSMPGRSSHHVAIVPANDFSSCVFETMKRPSAVASLVGIVHPVGKCTSGTTAATATGIWRINPEFDRGLLPRSTFNHCETVGASSVPPNFNPGLRTPLTET